MAAAFRPFDRQAVALPLPAASRRSPSAREIVEETSKPGSARSQCRRPSAGAVRGGEVSDRRQYVRRGEDRPGIGAPDLIAQAVYVSQCRRTPPRRRQGSRPVRTTSQSQESPRDGDVYARRARGRREPRGGRHAAGERPKNSAASLSVALNQETAGLVSIFHPARTNCLKS
jgi:hypothetical protein